MGKAGPRSARGLHPGQARSTMLDLIGPASTACSSGLVTFLAP